MRSAIAQFLKYLASERNASDLTIKAYREDLFGLVDWLEATRGDVPRPDALSPQDLRAFQAALQQAGYARTTIARKLASLRSFYRFAMRQGIATGNPAKPLRNPRRQRKLPHVLSNDEVGRLLLAPPANETMGLRDRAILETMYSAGLRVSELVALRDGDLDAYMSTGDLHPNKLWWNNGSGTFSGTLRLDVGDNRLPTTTKLSIGGAYSTAGGTPVYMIAPNGGFGWARVAFGDFDAAKEDQPWDSFPGAVVTNNGQDEFSIDCQSHGAADDGGQTLPHVDISVKTAGDQSVVNVQTILEIDQRRGLALDPIAGNLTP